MSRVKEGLPPEPKAEGCPNAEGCCCWFCWVFPHVDDTLPEPNILWAEVVSRRRGRRELSVVPQARSPLEISSSGGARNASRALRP